MENCCFLQVNSPIFNGIHFINILKEFDEPDMIRITSLSVLKILRMLCYLPLRARIFRDTPAAISYIASALLTIVLHLIAFYFMCEFSIMSMMLECCNKIALIKQWSPVFESFLNRSSIILYLINYYWALCAISTWRIDRVVIVCKFV